MYRLKIVLLYVLLTAGGLWHLIGVFQGIMQLLASPIMFGLAIWLFWECWRTSSEEERYRFAFWGIFVVVLSFGTEWFGVRTGRLFGAYIYGQTLRPTIDGIPVCIGCAWFVLCVASVAVVQRFAPNSIVNNRIKLAFCVALLMVCFDLFMEPAAEMLDYWTWIDNRIPLQNYLVWFVLGFAFTIFGLWCGLFSHSLPNIAFHFYFAQLIYFGLVDIKYL